MRNFGKLKYMKSLEGGALPAFWYSGFCISSKCQYSVIILGHNNVLIKVSSISPFSLYNNNPSHMKDVKK